MANKHKLHVNILITIKMSQIEIQEIFGYLGTGQQIDMKQNISFKLFASNK